MGVQGLWDLIRPAAAKASLTTLARDAFLSNKNGLRALTLGIDASIWIFHASLPREGENPFLRTLFYKITAVLQQPVLPVFVFDGPNKPSHKRNQAVAGHFGTSDHSSRQFKELLDVCGLEWWNAPGEAEAELAVMNRQGKIDAVLSDDVDTLLFGAACLMRNKSPTLSGASKTQDKSLGDYEVFRSSAVLDRWRREDGSKLATEEDCRMAMVLIALMSGGDYAPEGFETIGPTIAFALAKAGCADFLRLYTSDPVAFQRELSEAQRSIVEELQTDRSNLIGRKYVKRAEKLLAHDPTSLFPTFALDAYLKPCTSLLSDPTQGWPGFGHGSTSRMRGKARNEGRGDLEGLARACERYFEWGTRERVIAKFAGEAVGVFNAEVLNEARETVRRQHMRGSISPAPPTPSSQIASTSRITSFFQTVCWAASPKANPTQLPPRQSPPHNPPRIIKIHSTRPDPTNNDLTEYRVSYEHARYVERCCDAMEGTRIDPTNLSTAERAVLGMKGRNDDDDEPATTIQDIASSKTEIRVWMPEYLVRAAWPELVTAYEQEKRAKEFGVERGHGRTKVTKTTKARKGKCVEKGPTIDMFFRRQPHVAGSVEEEEIEIIEHRSPRRTNSRNASPLRSPKPLRAKSPSLPNLGKKGRLHPTSSLSSLGSTLSRESTSPIARVPLSTVRGRSKSKSMRATSPKAASASKGSRTIKTGFPKKSIEATGSQDEPTDLCSTDHETPRARRQSSRRSRQTSALSPTVLSLTTSNSNLPKAPKPSEAHSESRKSPTKKTKQSTSGTNGIGAQLSTQTRLQLPVFSKTTTRTGTTWTKPLPGPRPSKRVTYVVVSETEDVEVLDCTIGR